MTWLNLTWRSQILRVQTRALNPSSYTKTLKLRCWEGCWLLLRAARPSCFAPQSISRWGRYGNGVSLTALKQLAWAFSAFPAPSFSAEAGDLHSTVRSPYIKADLQHTQDEKKIATAYQKWWRDELKMRSALPWIHLHNPQKEKPSIWHQLPDGADISHHMLEISACLLSYEWMGVCVDYMSVSRCH